MSSDVKEGLVRLGRWLAGEGYAFVAVTPQTHHQVVRGRGPAQSLRDVFGWNQSFTAGVLPDLAMDWLRSAGLLLQSKDGYRSAVRFACLGRHLFAHSAFPTDEVDSVFFGPDTYRFCRSVAQAIANTGPLVDIGCGSGAAGIMVADKVSHVILADISDKALTFAQANAALAGVSNVEFVKSDVLAQVSGPLDTVICNPPYLRDPAGRIYRDGGGSFGEALAVRIVAESVKRLTSGGTLMLYTGATIVDGVDIFRAAVEPLLLQAHAAVAYEEIDPDVFGEELASPAYAGAERIAAVFLSATVP